MEDISLSPLVKQETRGKCSSVMHGRQVSVPASGPPSSPNELLLVSPPTQEDLWHLPGQLRINPSLWGKDDVSHWLRWAQKEYSLSRSGRERFEMNGRALCLLTKEDFRRRCPSSGDVLYEILQCVKQQRRGVVCAYQNESPSLTIGHMQNTATLQISKEKVTEPQLPSTNSTQVSHSLTAAVSSGIVTSVTSQPEPMSPHIYTTADFSSTIKQLQCPLPAESVNREPLNLCSREKARSPVRNADGRMPDCRLLWDYVYHLLCDDRYHDYIRWEDQGSLVFRVVDPDGLARLWGNHKNRDNMTYEKMSRALRHYYKLNIIKKERGQKFLFRFLKVPRDIMKQQAEPPETQEQTPPQDKEFQDSSPIQKLNFKHFEVSPDRVTPQSSPTPTAPPVR